MMENNLMTPIDMRREIYKIIESELKALPKILDQLEPKERAKALGILLKFVDWGDENNWRL